MTCIEIRNRITDLLNECQRVAAKIKAEDLSEYDDRLAFLLLDLSAAIETAYTTEGREFTDSDGNAVDIARMCA